MTRLRLGTRGSLLALAQSRGVAAAIEAANPGLSIEIVEIHTSGDRIRDVPLGPHLGQAFFTKEIEDALLDGRVDLAVHSCKDLASVLPDGLSLGALPEREDPRDALVSMGARLADLPAGARVGTSSPRRKRFLAQARPDLQIQEQRGNVPTRVRAVDEGKADAVVLAVAGLRRLGLAERIVDILDPDVMLPAAAQGALAIEVRADDATTGSAVSKLDDATTRAEVSAERACLRRLQAGCQAPVGVLGRLSDGTLRVRAAVASPDGIVRASEVAAPDGADEAGTAVAEALLAELGLASLEGVGWAGAPPRSRSET